VASPGGQTCLFVVSLEAPLHLLPPGATHEYG